MRCRSFGGVARSFTAAAFGRWSARSGATWMAPLATGREIASEFAGRAREGVREET